MAHFPLDTSHILTLSENMVAGFKDNDSVYPSPPIPSDDLEDLRNAAMDAYEAQIAAQAAAKATTEKKQAAFNTLVAAMKDDITYAEFTAKTPADLALIGWGPRAEPTSLATPGQPGSLEMPKQGAGLVKLTWNKPKSGGKPAFYKAEIRTVDPAGKWTLKGTSTSTEVELLDLQRGVELEFRIIAENSTGVGEPSNSVTAVL
ncbi:MAG: fibronectin type III domain-containing protein [Candidatus Electrothrix sp. MAN1_4]|nr:fibronectin type III domain-containing protein [Candidatus Electrothrix sp. MAN1_4]